MWCEWQVEPNCQIKTRMTNNLIQSWLPDSFCSVIFQKEWKELPAHGMYCMNISTEMSAMEATLYPWVHRAQVGSATTGVLPMEECRVFNISQSVDLFSNVTVGDYGVLCNFSEFNTLVLHLRYRIRVCKQTDHIHEISCYASQDQIHLAEQLLEMLSNAVKIRVEAQTEFCSNCLKTMLCDCSDVCDCILSVEKLKIHQSDDTTCCSDSQACRHAKVAILFSGGIDSLVIAALADR